MTRRAVLWWVVAGIATVALGATWFFSEFTRVPSTRWEQEGPEARKNPYLALQRFIAAMGRPLRTVPDARSLDRLPRGGVLILDRGRRRHLPPERADKVLGWVADGGYLIVAAEGKGTDDPILRRLDVSWYEPPKPKDNEDGAPIQRKAAPAAPLTVPVSVRQAGPLRLQRSGIELVAGKVRPAWAAEAEPGRAEVLHYAWGKGRITVFPSLQAFTNRGIGQYDHADILWALLSAYQPQGTVRLAARLKVPTLWEWLAAEAWMPLASGAVLCVLWLWRIVPRFGGRRSLPEPERRGLADHLAAVGRGVRREGGLSLWLNLVRQALLARISRRHPDLLRLPPAECAAALARVSGLTGARVRQALEGRGAESPRAFADTVRAMQQLLQRL